MSSLLANYQHFLKISFKSVHNFGLFVKGHPSILLFYPTGRPDTQTDRQTRGEITARQSTHSKFFVSSLILLLFLVAVRWEKAFLYYTLLTSFFF